MAIPDDIETITVSASLHLAELQTAIQYNETLKAEFIYMERDDNDHKFNILYYELHDSDVPHDVVNLQAVPPNLTDQQASDWLDKLVEAGLQPFKSYFNVMVADKYVSILPCRQGAPPPLPANLQGWIKTTATVFGLNMNGSLDAGDNGVGAPILGSIGTANKEVVGCALPIPVLRRVYGSLLGAKGKEILVRKDGDTGPGIKVRIVDLGPSNAQIRKGIALDLTYAAQKAIDGNGMTPVEYNFALA